MVFRQNHRHVHILHHTVPRPTSSQSEKEKVTLYTMLFTSTIHYSIGVVTLVLSLTQAGLLKNRENPFAICNDGYSSQDLAECNANCKGGACPNVAGPCIIIHNVCTTSPIYKCHNCPKSSSPSPKTPPQHTTSSLKEKETSTPKPSPSGSVTTSGNPIQKGYVAFGDSFAAGIGTGETGGTPCRVGQFSYPKLLASTAPNANFQNFACTGDTTKNILMGKSFLGKVIFNIGHGRFIPGMYLVCDVQESFPTFTPRLYCNRNANCKR